MNLKKKNLFTSKNSVAYPLIVITALLIMIKFTFWNYSFKNIIPKTSYEVDYNLSLEGYNNAINVNSFLPVSDDHQSIKDEVHNSGSFQLKIGQNNNGRIANWDNGNATGNQHINYSFSYLGKSIKYSIDTTLLITDSYPPDVVKYLEATPNIQVNHPFLIDLYNSKVGNNKHVFQTIKSIFDYTYSLTPKPFKGLTDALTAAQLGEASCNGKSRLFVALARQAGIPSRLVGGIILDTGQKRTSHQWTEIYVNGYWIPFDPLNNHFAFLPHNYLVLYKGDEFLFAHTPNIHFDYNFTIKKRLVANPTLLSELSSHPFNAYEAWQAFENVGIPLGLLKIIIMLPLGALVVAIFRNVIGLQTFGVFLPALVAIACRQTGLTWGVISFIIVIVVVSLIHFPLEKIGILYTPKMVIMLVFVVMAFLLISILGIKIEIQNLAYITLFPIVVVTITAERFARSIMEEGILKSFKMTLHTIVVIVFAYMAMNSSTMESLFLAFPELFLAIIGISLILGKWIGFRMSEYSRFKWILK
jgi:hypothetical protein